MSRRRIHQIAGSIIAVFIVLHLVNHLTSIWGVQKHIETMNALRIFYRNIFAESVLLFAMLVQVISGLQLYKKNKEDLNSTFDKLQNLTGVYLALFFSIHVSAVLGGRFLLHLDTNFYYGVAGLNTFPFNLFFIPYYILAILSFFGHIASIHNKKMNQTVLSLTPKKQSAAIVLFGILITIILFYGLTNNFKGIIIPTEYKMLIDQ